MENSLAFVIYDIYPVTAGHALIIPKRHFSDFFDMKEQEMAAVRELLCRMREKSLQKYPDIRGFNVGVNVGEAAGQTIPHCHIHLIPRREGDMQHPEGGVRGVIPEQQKYAAKGKTS